MFLMLSWPEPLCGEPQGVGKQPVADILAARLQFLPIDSGAVEESNRKG